MNFIICAIPLQKVLKYLSPSPLAQLALDQNPQNFIPKILNTILPHNHRDFEFPITETRTSSCSPTITEISSVHRRSLSQRATTASSLNRSRRRLAVVRRRHITISLSRASSLESARQQPSRGEHQPASGGEQLQEPPAEVPQHEDVPSAEQQPASETQTVSQKMEIPNNKVGVLIGKAGDTIRFLQINSGAKIQIIREADADPYSATQPVELIGTSENINMAEKLIKDVIAEADAGGSPSLVARGFGMVQAAGTVEQVLIQVPNEKVGVIIGKGGETIKNLLTRSGAHIQLIPHLPDGDQSKERTVRVAGDKKQIEMAREMIKEVMNQVCLNFHLSFEKNRNGYCFSLLLIVTILFC
ncbi:hypothetical protein ACSBR1_003034 [Camellia fascicularis]